MRKMFLSVIDTETNHKTTEYCLKLAQEAIYECQSLCGCFVKSFVNDNESKIVKLSQFIRRRYLQN